MWLLLLLLDIFETFSTISTFGMDLSCFVLLLVVMVAFGDRNVISDVCIMTVGEATCFPCDSFESVVLL